MFVGVLALTE